MAVIFGFSGADDRIYGTTFDGTIYGLSGADRIWGDNADDTLFGGARLAVPEMILSCLAAAAMTSSMEDATTILF